MVSKAYTIVTCLRFAIGRMQHARVCASTRQAVLALSGGWQMRLALACAVAQKATTASYTCRGGVGRGFELMDSHPGSSGKLSAFPTIQRLNR